MAAIKNQKTILCVWEIGGELGHISRFSAITKALESEGHHIVLALKDLSRAYAFFKNTHATLLQSPVWLPKVSMQRPIACLADTLLCMGYLEPDPLDCLVQAWESIINMVKPDLVIFDYAPTAMIALHDHAVPKLLIGTGFADPVPDQRICDWRPYAQEDQLVERQEHRVLETINKVLMRRNKPALKYLGDLFAVNRVLISTFPELDLYGINRKNADYCVGASTNLVDSEVRFLSDDRPRILAYLKPSYPNISLLVAALAGCKASVFIACPSGAPHLFTPYVSDRFQFSTELIDLQAAMEQVDLFVGHGNSSSCKEALLAAVPLILLPIQLEQLLTARKIQEAGLGVLVEKIPEIEELVELFNTILDNNKSYRAAIEKLLERHPEPRESIAEAVNRSVQELVVP